MNDRDRYVWAVYDPENKAFIRDCGYYGNSYSILAMETKELCQKYCVHKSYKPKRMRVK